jgi:hypothetical protein
MNYVECNVKKHKQLTSKFKSELKGAIFMTLYNQLDGHIFWHINSMLERKLTPPPLGLIKNRLFELLMSASYEET